MSEYLIAGEAVQLLERAFSIDPAQARRAIVTRLRNGGLSARWASVRRHVEAKNIFGDETGLEWKWQAHCRDEMEKGRQHHAPAERLIDYAELSIGEHNLATLDPRFWHPSHAVGHSGGVVGNPPSTRAVWDLGDFHVGWSVAFGGNVVVTVSESVRSVKLDRAEIDAIGRLLGVATVETEGGNPQELARDFIAKFPRPNMKECWQAYRAQIASGKMGRSIKRDPTFNDLFREEKGARPQGRPQKSPE